ncbi:DUF6058 family natural product biosynthesis protein [Micromonospora sp. NBC_00362]|uniref:DUF6058 family natural product biosynthesis protein n=1 Tax=Micromonospora sp. NBC_00362 TaxID=2975975 RepID=UPI00224EEA5F|nr:DUF6058 family natural product biosynthesis protein [Micromonospora sp. NBC_00362]MCX5122093.1 DUF6058 family natural product biosynthesis protein [Micromonospora sp. NBC_00362]
MTEEPTLSSSDLAYLSAEYRTLEQLCASRDEMPGHVRELIAAGRLPQATYVLPDGVELYPPDYFALVDDAGGVDELFDHFRSRYAAASRDLPDDANETWQGYLSGEFGICLWSLTPEAMAEKTRLMNAIEALIAAPEEVSEVWRAALRENVERLDALERPFTDYDRQRWGDTSRDRCIIRVRQRFSAVFDAPAMA